MNSPISAEERSRRVALICGYCLRNLVFYNLLKEYEEEYNLSSSELWNTIGANFLDICILEWCKLFVDEKAKHYYGKVIEDKDTFLTKMLLSLEIDISSFNKYKEEVACYRNKFIAHLDNRNTMNIPYLSIIEKSTSFLANYLFTHKDSKDYFANYVQITSNTYCQKQLEQARKDLFLLPTK